MGGAGLGAARGGLLFLGKAVGALLFLLALLVVLAQVALAAETPRVVRPRVGVLADGGFLEVRALVVAVGAELARVDLPHLLAGEALPKQARLHLPRRFVLLLQQLHRLIFRQLQRRGQRSEKRLCRLGPIQATAGRVGRLHGVVFVEHCLLDLFVNCTRLIDQIERHTLREQISGRDLHRCVGDRQRVGGLSLLGLGGASGGHAKSSHLVIAHVWERGQSRCERLGFVQVRNHILILMLAGIPITERHVLAALHNSVGSVLGLLAALNP